MSGVELSITDGLATVTLARGKVNALNEPLVSRLSETFVRLADDDEVAAVVLTGRGAFFSFGFDIPQFLSYSRADFTGYLTRFAALYRQLWLFPRPLVAAINGHAVAGGCMLATACDRRLMVPGKAKISLNEITFGASVFAGAVAMLTHWVGARAAEQILLGGAMYSAEQAAALGLVDRVVAPAALQQQAAALARKLGSQGRVAHASIKGLLRHPAVQRWDQREQDSIEAFVEIWYSEATWSKLQQIKIR